MDIGRETSRCYVPGAVNVPRVVARLLRAKAENGDGPLADLQIITDEALVVGNAPSIRQIVGVLRYVDAHVVLSHKKGADTTAAEIINRFEFFRAMGHSGAEAMRVAFSDEGAEADRAALEAAEMECTNVPSIVERVVARCLSPRHAETRIFISRHFRIWSSTSVRMEMPTCIRS